ncbi:MAG TPA: sodium:proton antiporter [Kofleriaceae bacterium]|nr:sodium:proton antiporter [Kofleriaceae bacterium]
MAVFELVIGLLFLGALLALWAHRRGLPYPALLALVGALLALVPGTPEMTFDPELALALFVAPALLDAAYDASPRDLRRNIVPVASLAVGMVLVTVVAVACAARLVVPDLGWAPAIALGAIVAPPDASAAAAMLRRLQPPHRLLVILEGESLFNDATALLVYRAAIGAAFTGAFSGWSVVPMLLVTAGGGIVAGYVLARLFGWLSARVEDVALNVLLQFVSTFAVWILADRAGLSAILTMVTFAMTLARRQSGQLDARHHIVSYAVWEVAVLVLNVLAFVLIGLQLRGIASRVEGPQWQTYVTCAVVVVVAVIVVRFAWIMLHTAVDRWHLRRARDDEDHESPPTFRAATLASWCGMRGIVTIAAALALPEWPAAFPYRDLIVLCAFTVVLATLVVQGLTLRPLMRLLRLRDEGIVEREIQLARAETARAALRVLHEEGPRSRSTSALAAEYQARLQAAEADGSREALRDDALLAALHRKTASVQRDVLVQLRSDHRIGDDAFHVVEEEIALLEINAEARVDPDGEDLAASSHPS